MEAGAVLRSADPGELPHGHRPNNDYLRKGTGGRRQEEAEDSYPISGFTILFLYIQAAPPWNPHYNNGDFQFFPLRIAASIAS